MRDYFGGNGCEVMDAFAVVITAREAARGQKARPGPDTSCTASPVWTSIVAGIRGTGHL